MLTSPGKMPSINFKHADTRFLVLATLCVGVVAVLGYLFAPQAAVLMTLVAVMIVILGRQTHLYRNRQDEDVEHRKHIQSLLWLYAQIPFRSPLPALTGWAASPQLACTVYELTRKHQPLTVVELGSGASTLVVAYALEANGRGHIYCRRNAVAFCCWIV